MLHGYRGTRGTMIRVGFNKTSGQGYIMAGHTSWQSIETGKQYPMTIQFDSEPAWTGSGTGIRLGTFPNIYMPYSDYEVIVGICPEAHNVYLVWPEANHTV